MLQRMGTNGPLTVLELIDLYRQFHLGDMLLEITSESVQVDRMPEKRKRKKPRAGW